MSDVEFPLLGYRIDGMPKTIAQRTRRVYDRLAAFYPLSTFLFHSKAHRSVLKQSGITDGMCVLEAATGSGEMFRRLVKANRNGTTLGMDLSPNMAARTLGRVRRSFPRSRTHCHAVDARYMPYPDGAFDAVVCCYLLELLSGEDIVRTIGEFHRILRARRSPQPGTHRPEHGGLQPDLPVPRQHGSRVLGPTGGAARSRVNRGARLPHRV